MRTRVLMLGIAFVLLTTTPIHAGSVASYAADNPQFPTEMRKQHQSAIRTIGGLIVQDQIRSAGPSEFKCLTRGHGDASYSVSRHLQISLRVQGDKRFIFDYENSHDMMGPIRLVDIDFTKGSQAGYNKRSLASVPM